MPTPNYGGTGQYQPNAYGYHPPPPQVGAGCFVWEASQLTLGFNQSEFILFNCAIHCIMHIGNELSFHMRTFICQ